MGKLNAWAALVCAIAVSVVSTAALGAIDDPIPSGRLIVFPSAFVSRQEGAMYRERIFGKRGFLFVSENRADSKSRTIEIGFWLLPSTAQHPRAPIVYLMGGPGHANIDTWREPAKFAILNRLRAISDVILFDQRGSGSPSESLPSLQCAEPFEFPFLDAWETRQQMVSGFTRHIATCAAAFARAGIDIRGYTTEESAADLDELRQALGYAKLNIWGYSYGSFLARTFVNLYPASIERAAIGGNMPEAFVRADNPAVPALETLAKGFTTDKGEVIPPAATLGGDLKTARKRLNEDHVVVTVKRPDTGKDVQIALGVFDLNFQIVWALSSPTSSWPDLRHAIAQSAKGDFSWLAERAILWRLGKHRSLLEGKMNGVVMSCSAMKDSSAARVLISNAAHDPFQGENGNGPLPEACAGLSDFAIPHHVRWRRSSVETIYYNGELDPQTDPANAYAALRDADRAELLIVKGASHYLDTPDEIFLAFAGAPLVPGRIRFVAPVPSR